MKRMRTDVFEYGHDYGRWFWHIEDGKVEIWKNLSNRQLANLYNFFQIKIDTRFQSHYNGALDWIRKEAECRGVTYILKYTEDYGSYPYLYHGRWLVFDRKEQKDIPLVDYDWSKIPPDAIDELTVMKMLGLIK